MTPAFTPSPGRIVLYTLTAVDAEHVNRRREDAEDHRATRVADGAQVHVGNTAFEGDQLAALIVRVWTNDGEPTVNAQVFLDGNDTLWITSRRYADKPGTPGTWSPPPRV